MNLPCGTRYRGQDGRQVQHHKLAAPGPGRAGGVISWLADRPRHSQRVSRARTARLTAGCRARGWHLNWPSRAAATPDPLGWRGSTATAALSRLPRESRNFGSALMHSLLYSVYDVDFHLDLHERIGARRHGELLAVQRLLLARLPRFIHHPHPNVLHLDPIVVGIRVPNAFATRDVDSQHSDLLLHVVSVRGVPERLAYARVSSLAPVACALACQHVPPLRRPRRHRACDLCP